MNHRNWSILIIIILLGEVISCRGRIRKKNSPKSQETQAISVEAVYPQYRSMREEIEVSGNLEPLEKAEVYAKQSGIVQAVYVEEGDEVKRGELLAKIEDDEIRLSYQQAKNAYQLARDKYQRYLQLYQERMISEQDFKEIERAYKDAESNYKLYQLQLENTELRAPIDGVVIERLCEPHQLIGAMEKAFTIARLDQYQVMVYVTEEDLGKIKPSQKVLIRIDAIDTKQEGYPHQGVVSEIGARVDPNTGTARVKILIPQPPPQSKPGMFARMKIITRIKEDVFSIPKRALVQEEPYQVWIVKENKAHLKEIKVGMEDEYYIEVIDGLSPDDLVVIAGQDALTEETLVQVVNLPKKPNPKPLLRNESKSSPEKED